MNSLDNILSGREPASATETQDTTAAAEATAEQTTEQTTDSTDTGGDAADSGKQPPIGAIRQAEREKATKRYTEQVADFDKRLAETNAAWDRRFTQLLETVKPKAEPQQAPDIFENAPRAILHTVEPHLNQMRESNVYNSRLIAEVRHTEDVVKAADTAFTQAYQAGTLDPADYQRIISSPNIFDAAVKWHKRTQAQQRIGDDPDAFEKKLEAEIRAKVEAEYAQDGNQQQGAQRRPAMAMPSNLAAARNVGSRSGPAWGGPTPLNDIFKR